MLAHQPTTPPCASALTDAQLVGAVLQRAPTACEALLEQFGSLDAMARAGPGVWERHGARDDGCAISAALEIGHRVRRRARARRPSVESAHDVVELLGPELELLDYEQMWLLALDGRSGLRGMRCISQGGAHGCALHARDVLRAALWEGASGFILAHNHPSGDTQPSAEDLTLTRGLDCAASVIGIPLIDHVIIAPTGDFLSLLDQGYLKEADMTPR